MIRADGSVIWVHDEAVVVRDEAGKPLYSQGFWVDITERKQLEEALHAREADLAREKQYFQSLVEVSPVAIVTMDIEERVTGWNPAATRLFGYEEVEALGRTITELVLDSEDLGPDAAIPPSEVLATGRVDRVTRRHRKDGSPVDVEVSMVPLHVDGQHRGFYAIYRDITERLRSERTQAEYLEQVGRVVDAAAAVEVDDFEPESLDGVAARDDALGQLARVFQRMAREIFERERRLKAQVQQLRIEIDEAKAAQKVEEIADTDYFRELQQKASRLRLDSD